MYDKMLEQAESFFKPVNDILQLNVEAFDTIRVKQTDLVNDVLADSIEYAKGLGTPSLDVDSYITAQQSYWQGVQSKITHSAQDSYDLLNDVQGKVGGLIKGAWDLSESKPANNTVAKNADSKSKTVTKDAAPAAIKAKAPAKKKPVAKKVAKTDTKKTETVKVEN